MISKKNLYRLKIYGYLAAVFFFLPVFFDIVAGLYGLPPGFTLIFDRIHIFFFALIVMFFMYKEKSLMKRKHSATTKERIFFSVLALFFFGQYFFFKYIAVPTNELANFLLINTATFYILGALTLFLVLFGKNFFLQILKENQKDIFAMVLLLLIFSQIKSLLDFNWTTLSFLVANIIKFFLSPFYTATYIPQPDGGASLLVEDFGAGISKDCSGIESSILFLFLFAIIVVYDKRLKKDSKLFAFAFAALLGNLVVVALRISLISIIAVEIGEDLALTLFHNNIGWTLFIVYFALFYHLLGRWFSKEA